MLVTLHEVLIASQQHIISKKEKKKLNKTSVTQKEHWNGHIEKKNLTYCESIHDNGNHVSIHYQPVNNICVDKLIYCTYPLGEGV